MTYSHLLQSIYYFFCYFFLCYGCSEQKTESIYFFPAHDGKKAGPIPFSEGQSHINRNHPRPRISRKGHQAAGRATRGPGSAPPEGRSPWEITRQQQGPSWGQDRQGRKIDHSDRSPGGQEGQQGPSWGQDRQGLVIRSKRTT